MNREVRRAFQAAHSFTVHQMKPFATVAYGALFAASLTATSVAQTTPPLAYVQPVSPAAVQEVQQRLHSAGAYNGALDGVWGPDSAAALQQYQSSHQLQVTGQLNQATTASLGVDLPSLLGTQQAMIPPALPPSENLRPSSVRVIQSRLHSLGFYSGAVDGVWGQSTQTAIEQFQQGRGLQPDGHLTAPTLAALGLSPDSLAYR